MIDVTKPTLMELFGQIMERFLIPPYQRCYEWSQEQCSALLDDAIKAGRTYRDDQDATHFFGSVIVCREGRTAQLSMLSIVDGQQRLTTAMLLAAAIRDVAPSFAGNGYLMTWLSVGGPMDSASERVRLTQVEADRGPFERIMLGLPPEPGDKSSAAWKNYAYFKRQLRDPSVTGDITPEYVFWGLTRFQVIRIVLDRKDGSSDSPQQVFESMNSLSLPLTFADLVRNRLLMTDSLDAQDERYHRYWLPIERTFKENDDGRKADPLSDFIRDWLQMRGAKWVSETKTEKQKRDVYLQFKQHIDGQDAGCVLADMKRAAEAYVTMVSEKASFPDTEIDEVVGDIERIQAKAARPVVLWVLMAVRAEEIDRDTALGMLTALRTYLLRRRIVGLKDKNRTSGENRALPTWVPRLEAISKDDDPWAAMMGLFREQGKSITVPSDGEVAEVLMGADFYQASNRNNMTPWTVLVLVEKALTKERPKGDAKSLQLEHIMPRTLTQAWVDELGVEDRDAAADVRKRWANNIGNITLTRHNQEMGNRPFKDKVAVYESKAGLQVCRDHVTDRDRWDADAVERRAKWLCDVIVRDVAPLPWDSADETVELSSDLDITGRELVSFELMGEPHACDRWVDMLVQVVNLIGQLDRYAVVSAVKDGTLSGWVSLEEKLNYGKGSEGLWVYKGMSNESKVTRLTTLMDVVKLPYEYLRFTVRPDMSGPGGEGDSE